jgi:hypothetical protein
MCHSLYGCDQAVDCLAQPLKCVVCCSQLSIALGRGSSAQPHQIGRPLARHPRANYLREIACLGPGTSLGLFRAQSLPLPPLDLDLDVSSQPVWRAGAHLITIPVLIGQARDVLCICGCLLDPIQLLVFAAFCSQQLCA